MEMSASSVAHTVECREPLASASMSDVSEPELASLRNAATSEGSTELSLSETSVGMTADVVGHDSCAGWRLQTFACWKDAKASLSESESELSETSAGMS